jgi:hypothetical protein
VPNVDEPTDNTAHDHRLSRGHLGAWNGAGLVDDSVVHIAGPVPPGAQGPKRVLEGVQQPLHPLPGFSSGCSLHHQYDCLQDALVAAYPKIPNEGKNTYVREELYYHI